MPYLEIVSCGQTTILPPLFLYNVISWLDTAGSGELVLINLWLFTKIQ